MAPLPRLRSAPSRPAAASYAEPHSVAGAVTSLLVLHTLGEPAGGARWRRALEDGGWPGPWAAPDLPGHGAAPMPAGGAYDRGDPALVGLRALLDAGWDQPSVVVGERDSGLGALVLAAGGRAAGVVVVDGLGRAWPASADDAIGEEYAWLRAIADDQGATELPVPGADPDPRSLHGYAPMEDPAFWSRLVAAVRVPALAVESRASPTPPSDVGTRTAGFGGGCTVEWSDTAGSAVLPAIRRWWAIVGGETIPG